MIVSFSRHSVVESGVVRLAVVAMALAGLGCSGGDTGADGETDRSGATSFPALASGAVVNGIEWADSTGNPIQAHGGGILKVGSFYYWFGENRNPDGTFFAVSCYRSTDLRTWEFRNNVLTANSSADLKPANIERPKVVFNASTGKYVMWMHRENGTDYSEARAAVASSSTVDGSYTYQGSFRPFAGTGVVDHGKPGYMSRDSTLFVDTDGTGYFISATNENTDLNLYRLTSDYLSISSLAAVLFKGAHREAPALFKRSGVYFLLTSAATGWNPNQAQYATSTSLTGGWSGLTNVGDSTTFHSQPAFVLPVQGSSGTAYLYMGDRWAGAWGGQVNDSPYVWQPISFSSNTSMSMTWSNTLTIDAGAGTITGSTKQFSFINHNSGKLMEVLNASTADGAKIDQFTQNGGNNQKWTFTYDGAGFSEVVNVGSGKLLDVTSSSTADGTALIQFTENGGDNQKWLTIDKGSGLVQLKNKHSGKLAEVSGGSTANAATVDQRSANGSAQQLWQMIVAN
jgi:hypothetical protein